MLVLYNFVWRLERRFCSIKIWTIIDKGAFGSFKDDNQDSLTWFKKKNKVHLMKGTIHHKMCHFPWDMSIDPYHKTRKGYCFGFLSITGWFMEQLNNFISLRHSSNRTEQWITNRPSKNGVIADAGIHGVRHQAQSGRYWLEFETDCEWFWKL